MARVSSLPSMSFPDSMVMDLTFLRGVRVLVVEDDTSSRKLVLMLLKKFGMRCEGVEDGSDALQLVLDDPHRFDLMLMDGHMPRMSGIEATRRIRRAGVTIPIFALTGNALDKDQVAFEYAGANAVLVKPFNKQAFIEHAYALFANKHQTVSDVESG
eukprot:TRINITY_DN7158_c0_g1_i5.p1 TRINITY_DN7158_c0_g1~~TRINITY_DN7158_c0_g1_i5.p1  ORF type:complete len:157 (-),score=12.10 TRINITY_DN7158_c0_g1_i5:116-586(-)